MHSLVLAAINSRLKLLRGHVPLLVVITLLEVLAKFVFLEHSRMRVKEGSDLGHFLFLSGRPEVATQISDIVIISTVRSHRLLVGRFVLVSILILTFDCLEPISLPCKILPLFYRLEV